MCRNYLSPPTGERFYYKVGISYCASIPMCLGLLHAMTVKYSTHLLFLIWRNKAERVVEKLNIASVD